MPFFTCMCPGVETNSKFSNECYICRTPAPAADNETEWVAKPLAEGVVTQQSLLNLRKELEERETMTVGVRMIIFKINSCLYSTYPHTEKT